MTTPSETALSACPCWRKMPLSPGDPLAGLREAITRAHAHGWTDDAIQEMLDAARSQPATEELREALRAIAVAADDVVTHYIGATPDTPMLRHSDIDALDAALMTARAALAATEPDGDER